MTINSAMTLIVTYVEKVVNNNASNEDTKCNDVSLSSEPTDFERLDDCHENYRGCHC